MCLVVNLPVLMNILLWHLGTSYLEWFTSYVNKVVTGGYPIIRDQIFRYRDWDLQSLCKPLVLLLEC